MNWGAGPGHDKGRISPDVLPGNRLHAAQNAASRPPTTCSSRLLAGPERPGREGGIRRLPVHIFLCHSWVSGFSLMGADERFRAKARGRCNGWWRCRGRQVGGPGDSTFRRRAGVSAIHSGPLPPQALPVPSNEEHEAVRRGVRRGHVQVGRLKGGASNARLIVRPGRIITTHDASCGTGRFTDERGPS